MANVQDKVANFLAQIDNAQERRYATVSIPGSTLRRDIAKIMEKYGYVESVEWDDTGPQGEVVIELRYDEDGEPIIRSMERESKPARRDYVSVDEIPDVLNGLGIAVLSTSKGIMAGRDARAANVGGELLCSIY